MNSSLPSYAMQVSREFRGSRPRRSWGFDVGAVAAKRRLSRDGVRLHGGCELNDDKHSELRRAHFVVRRVAGENRSGRGGEFRAGACSCSLPGVQAIHRTGARGERGAREFFAGLDHGYGGGRCGAAPPAVVGQFASLGHTTTPALLVLDQEGRVRFTTQSPRSSREVAGLRRIIEGLTWIEDL